MVPIVIFQMVKNGDQYKAYMTFLSISLKLSNWLEYYEGKIGSILYSKSNLLNYYNKINNKMQKEYEEFQALNPFDTRNIASKGIHICGLKMRILAIKDSGKLPQSVANSDKDEATEL